MAELLKSEILEITGMSCVSCENRIAKKLRKEPGIKNVKVSYNKGAAELLYDTSMISTEEIIKIIEVLGYEAIRGGFKAKPEIDMKMILGVTLIIFVVFFILRRSGWDNLFNRFPLAKDSMGYGMLFLIGILTSLHCVAMCGGINLSQCIPQSDNVTQKRRLHTSLRPSILYNSGRVISYTLIGGIVGALGSVVNLTGGFKGVVQLAAGAFMIIMGLNMLHLFPGLRKWTPRMPQIIAKKLQSGKNSRGPLYIGLLNGFMPCGPLQAMQLYALSTGDPIKGALSMLLFSLGTIPLMFGLGALSAMLTRKFTQKAMAVGAVLVVILGVSMFSSGLSLSDFGMAGAPAGRSKAETGQTKAGIADKGKTDEGKTDAGTAEVQEDMQIVNTSLNSGRYEPVIVKKGIPVKWTITVEQGTMNNCNNRMVIPEYNLEKEFEVGENIVEFTPAEAGVYTYSCWMGMIRSTITVEE